MKESFHPIEEILTTQNGKRDLEIKSKEKINYIISTILDNLLDDPEMNENRIDYVSTYWSDYSVLESLSEIHELNRKMNNIAKGKLINTKSITRENCSLIASNESKCRSLKTGKDLLMNQIYSKEDNSNSIFLDLTTFTSGIVTKRESTGEFTGLFCGFGLNIIDHLIKSHKKSNINEISQVTLGENGKIYEEEIADFASQITKLIEVKEVSSGRKSVGGVPINVERSYDNHISILGCDVGINGSKMNKIEEIGTKAKSYGAANLAKLSEKIFYRIFGEIIASLETNELLPNGAKLYISTRKDVPVKWKSNLADIINKLGYKDRITRIRFLKNPSTIGFASEPLN